MPIAAAATAAAEAPGMGFVVLMGIGTVFFGLICIIVLTVIMGKIMSKLTPPPAPKNDTIAEVKKVAVEHPQQTASGIPNDVIVAIMAALSEDPGISSRGWNITSIKKSI
ncbi:MAG: OadG family protein [Oscillospiraceae bacterium]|nr:OadG family protein [Oscillospiraceae bacterium]